MSETQIPPPEAAEKKDREGRIEKTKTVAAKCIIQHVMDQARVRTATPDKDTNPDYGTPGYVIQKMSDIIRFTGGTVTIKTGDETVKNPRVLVLDSGKDTPKNSASMPKIAPGEDGEWRASNSAAESSATNIITGRVGDMLHVALPDQATAQIHMHEMILAMTRLHAEVILKDMSLESANVVLKSLRLIEDPNDRTVVPPTDAELHKAESAVRHIGKFGATDAIITAVFDEQRSHIREAEGDTKMSDEELAQKTTATLTDTASQVKNPDDLPALYARLTSSSIQNPEDLARATDIMMTSRIKNKLEALKADIAEATAAEARAQNQASSATTEDLKKKYATEQAEHLSRRRTLEAALESNKKYLKDMQSINELYCTKMQRGEFDTTTMELFTAALKGREDVTDLTQSILKNAGVTQDQLIDSLPSDQRELMTKLLEIGGPILVMMLIALLENMKRSAES